MFCSSTTNILSARFTETCGASGSKEAHRVGAFSCYSGPVPPPLAGYRLENAAINSRLQKASSLDMGIHSFEAKATSSSSLLRTSSFGLEGR